jgi:hypothetical protein
MSASLDAYLAEISSIEIVVPKGQEIPEEPFGRIAYEAYAVKLLELGGVEVPYWDELPQLLKQGWQEAAQEIYIHTSDTIHAVQDKWRLR